MMCDTGVNQLCRRSVKTIQKFAPELGLELDAEYQTKVDQFLDAAVKHSYSDPGL